MAAAIIIVIVRIVITLTFFGLVAEGIATIIIIRRFYTYYLQKHLELEGRVEAIERRLERI